MKKTTLIILGLMLLMQTLSFAQHEAIKAQFSQQMSKTQSISSNFKQTKNMKLLKESIVSTGNFYYKKDNKVRIEYKNPYNYLVILNNGQMSITDNFGKKTQMNTNSSKTLSAVNSVMVDCVNGNIFNNKNFVATATEKGAQYLVNLTPHSPEMKSMYDKIVATFDKKTLNILQLELTEKNGDITKMTYHNTQTNTPLNDQLFKVR